MKYLLTFVLIWLLPQLLMIFVPEWGEALAGVSSLRESCFMGNQYSKRPVGATWPVEKAKGVFYLYKRFEDGDRIIDRITPYPNEKWKNNKYSPHYVPPLPPTPEKIDYQEFWLPIPEFARYQVSNYGGVRKRLVAKVEKYRYIKGCIANNGYCYILIANKNRRKTFLLHRLVLSAFTQKSYNEELLVNHINLQKDINIATNLEWCTAKENTAHAILNGHGAPNGFKAGCKAHELNKIPIVQLSLEGIFISEYSSIADAIKKEGWDASYITKNCKRKRNTAYGFNWMYKSDYLIKTNTI